MDNSAKFEKRDFVSGLFLSSHVRALPPCQARPEAVVEGRTGDRPRPGLARGGATPREHPAIASISAAVAQATECPKSPFLAASRARDLPRAGRPESAPPVPVTLYSQQELD
jgi:hypothetical protein